jgi:hypothetical protein
MLRAALKGMKMKTLQPKTTLKMMTIRKMTITRRQRGTSKVSLNIKKALRTMEPIRKCLKERSNSSKVLNKGENYFWLTSLGMIISLMRDLRELYCKLKKTYSKEGPNKLKQQVAPKASRKL